MGKQLQDLVRAQEKNSGQRVYRIAVPVPKSDLEAAGYQPRRVQASSALVARLSARLRGILQAQDLQHGKPGMAGSRIARNRLHRIKTGEPRLFLRRHPARMVNTAVHLLVDNSASMKDNHRFYKTREVVLALTRALAPIRGVNLGMTVFPAIYRLNRHCSSSAIHVATVIAHGSRPGNDVLYPKLPNGHTPLSESLRYSASAMLHLQEPRKIMVILTDGEPDDIDDAAIAVREAMDLNIEVVALGIEQLTYPDIFPRFEIVHSVQDLPEKTFCLLERLLSR